MMRSTMTALALMLAFAGAGFAQTPEDAFNRGNELYRAGKYKEAVKEYESIIKHSIALALWLIRISGQRI